MNSSLKTIFTFALGAATGAVVARKVLEKRFEQRFAEEMELEREAFERRIDLRDGFSDTVECEEKTDREIAATMARQLGYTGEEDMDMDKPRIIHPDEYAENEEYDIQSLIYYADGVLTDDCNNPIEDVENLVGLNFADHFEDDSVFVINDRYKTYYEINRSLTNFSESEEAISRLLSLDSDE